MFILSIFQTYYMNQKIQTNEKLSQAVELFFTKALVEKYQIKTKFDDNKTGKYADIIITVKPNVKNWLNQSILDCWADMNEYIKAYGHGITHDPKTNEWILEAFIEK